MKESWGSRYYLEVRSKGLTVFRAESREEALPLEVAWRAALDVLLQCEAEPGYNKVVLILNGNKTVLEQ